MVAIRMQEGTAEGTADDAISSRLELGASAGIWNGPQKDVGTNEEHKTT